jgi:hypothetical protein
VSSLLGAEKIMISNREKTSYIYKVFLKYLNIPKKSQSFLTYLRNDEFKRDNKEFNKDFQNSLLNLVEKDPLGYKHMFIGLCLADNVGCVQVCTFDVEIATSGIAVIDNETGRAWLVGLCATRIKAQMRRQNLYVLEKMKGLKL